MIGGDNFQDMIASSAILLIGNKNTRYPYESAWSLSALLKLMPETIKEYYLMFDKSDSSYTFCYQEEEYKYELCAFCKDNPIDSAFEMIVWLRTNKYI